MYSLNINISEKQNAKNCARQFTKMNKMESALWELMMHYR